MSVVAHTSDHDAPSLRSLLHHRPDEFIVFWSVGGCFLLFTTVLTMRLLSRHARVAIRLRNQAGMVFWPARSAYVTTISLMPFFLSVFAILSLFIPRGNTLFELGQGLYLAYAFFTFFWLLLEYMGGSQMALKLLQEAEPQRHLAIPPFGCCFYPCCPAIRLSRTILVVCR